MKVRAFLLGALLTISQSALAANGTLLFVPLDDRPVCLDYTVESMKAAGWDVKTPPREYISGAIKKGEPDKIMDWLEENGKTSTAVIASSDALIYGGLVGSRTHEIPQEILQKRADRLLELKNNTHNQKVYIFTTIMRSPKASGAPVEPAYYTQWGPKLFRLGALEDKSELQRLHRKERKELKQLRLDIPKDVTEDLYGRRQRNIKITETLLHGIESGDFDYMLLGRDDTAQYSQAHREARAMDILVHELPKGKIRFFAGADQLGLVLLNRAANRLQYELPLVNVTYAAGVAGATIPSYEDNTVAESARQHIFAAGAFPVRNREKADLVLAINTPKNGKCLEASNQANNGTVTPEVANFAAKLERLTKHDYKIALADVKYGNGADNALVKELFNKKIAYELAAYGGWNTSGNTLGFALAQGLLTPKMNEKDKQYLLEQRYLDDWAYQANARMKVYQKVIWPQYWPNSGLKDEQLKGATKAVREEILATAKPLMGEKIKNYKITLPWNRMFEVQVEK
ncbi:MAG: DUF4127 family protein [Phascolarctobacterium sp.]|nr:DUF4127 family protein [Phascolarctobacterium sp.]